MRTIKFRGKEIYGGSWVYDESYRKTKVGVEIGDMDVAPETVGQFTGQTDTNGKEIYEGDILADEQGEDKIVVYWDEEDGVWLPDELPDCKCVCYYPMWTILVVIGNIHDNPELLESK